MANETIKQALDRADLNTLADIFRALRLGSILRGLKTALRRSATAASPYTAATGLVLTAQAEEAPAAKLVSAYAIAGAGTLGPLVVDAPGTVPAAGHVSIDFAGRVIAAAADAWAKVDVIYEPELGDLSGDYVGAVDPATGFMSLPVGTLAGGVVLVMEAEVLAGGSTGKKIISANGAAPAAGRANMDLAKSQVQFAVADAVTSARIKLFNVSAVDVNAKLESDSTFI